MWHWVIGALILGNDLGKKEAARKAAIERNRMLNLAYQQAVIAYQQQEQINNLQQTTQQLLCGQIQNRLRRLRTQQGYVFGNAYQLDSQLGLPHGTIYQQLDLSWAQYFKTTKKLQANGDFCGHVL